MGEPVAVPRQEPTGDHRKDRAGGRREERNDGATPASGDRLERTVDADGASCGEVRITAAAGVPAGPVTRAQWRPADNAQRTDLHLADALRGEHGEEGDLGVTGRTGNQHQ